RPRHLNRPPGTPPAPALQRPTDRPPDRTPPTRLRGGTEAPPRRRPAPLKAHPHRPGPRTAPSPHHQSGGKLTATLSLPWFSAVKADPFTWAVLLWFEAPEPTACCCVGAELPKWSPPTPLPTTPAAALAAVALDPLSATAPLSAVATTGTGAAANGRAG